MEYLSKEQILLIHSIIVDETGGSHGVRDYSPLLSLENSPRQNVFGKELYPTPFLKAAVYVRDIIGFHPFLDGNKRTAVTLAAVFLYKNGYRIVAKEGEIKKFALRVILRKLDVETIAEWLKEHSDRMKKRR